MSQVSNPAAVGPEGPAGTSFKLGAYSIPAAANAKQSYHPGPEGPMFAVATFTTAKVTGDVFTVKAGGEVVATLDVAVSAHQTVSFTVPTNFGWEWESVNEAESSATVTYAALT